jgi:lysozyme
MNTTDVGLGRLKAREGVVLSMYRDSAGLPTIGVGHLLTKDELSSGKLCIQTDWHNGITEQQCDDLLRQDLNRAEAAVSTLVNVELTGNQFDTLVSFVFNVGITAFQNSTLLRLLNTGNYASVPEQLRRWVYSAGRRDPILVNRREDEIRQWGGL